MWRAVIGLIVSLAVGFYAGRHATSYVLPVLIAVCVGVLTLIVPEGSFLVLLASTPFSFRFFLPNRSEVFVPSEPLVAALVGVYGLDRLVARVRGVSSESFPLGKPLLVFALTTLISIVPSPFFFESAKGAVRAVAYLFLPFPVYALLRDEGRLLRAIRVAVATGFVTTLIMIAFLVTRLDRLAHSEAFRGTLFGNYAVYGSFLSVFLLPLIARSLVDTSSYDRVRHGILLGVFGGGMLLCWSRGAWLSFLIGLVFLVGFSSRWAGRRKWTLIGIGGGIAILLLVTPGISEVIRSRAATLFHFDFASNRTRLLRWGFALEMFLQNPIFGGGYGAFARTYKSEVFLGEPGRYQLGAHSEHLQVLAEMGLVGFFGWLGLWIGFFRYAFRLRRRLEDSFWRSVVLGVTAYQVAFCVHFLVGNFLEGDRIAVPFWLGMGILPAIGRAMDCSKFVIKNVSSE